MEVSELAKNIPNDDPDKAQLLLAALLGDLAELKQEMEEIEKMGEE